MRRRYRWDPKTHELIEVPWDLKQPPVAPTVWNDLPGYDSPVTGEWIEGRKARREDLKRHDCRPYEGREQEMKEAQRRQAYNEAKLDQLAEKIAHRGWAEAPERIRRVFRGK